MNKINTISAVLVVSNEEKRISDILQSLQWCDEVVVIDKYSTDKTVEIASQFPNVRISYVDNAKGFSVSEVHAIIKEFRMKYSILATASDVIHPSLAMEIRKLMDDDAFDYDGISIPYKGYFLGMYEKFSPWYDINSIKVVKRSCLRMNEGQVHSAIIPNVKSIYKLTVNDPQVAYYHLTHESADGIIARHARYWRGEAISPDSLSDILKMLYNGTKMLIKRGTFFKGKVGLALAFSYLSYFMMAYVYKWDHLHGNADNVYSSIREHLMKEWEKYE